MEASPHASIFDMNSLGFKTFDNCDYDHGRDIATDLEGFLKEELNGCSALT